MKKKDFDQLVASVKQAGKIKRGKLKPARMFHFKPADIKAVREKLNVSQAQFAMMIWRQRVDAPELGARPKTARGSCARSVESGCGESGGSGRST